MRKQILDHGYIELVETWGSDQMIVESARMSTGKGFLGWGPKCECSGDPCLVDLDGESCERCGQKVKPGDEKLLAYMMKNAHDSPFEFGGMIIEVKAPLFVFREWHRHRSQGYSEASARFAPLPDDNYMPTVERCMLGGGHLTKQSGAHGDAVLTEFVTLAWLAKLANVYEHAEQVYQEGLRIGIPKEIARCSMTVARYSKMRATTNLRMWLAFAKLRTTLKNQHAQWEIRQYADAAGELLAEHFPRTWSLFAGTTG